MMSRGWLICGFIVLVDAAVVDWPSDKMIITPVDQRRGHDFYIRYDYRAGAKKYDHAGIAVLIDVDYISFTKFPLGYVHKTMKDDKCLTFQTPRGPQDLCGGYFLLVKDRYDDVTNENSPKFVGTYSKTTDSLSYTNDKGRRIHVSNFKRKIDNGLFSPDRYEVLCTSPRN
ncbi:hypothetical protein ANCCAN_12977 [Ancylostoma caninum]|uniref:Uncharacterized protein n=1 Tax=Ancylostoma caninum TaxID=29170 RepID=A0A368G9N6_ANCCA|nr:hypothetical protein ANCCAN_12977 [Ancylostoma caninum]